MRRRVVVVVYREGPWMQGRLASTAELVMMVPQQVCINYVDERSILTERERKRALSSPHMLHSFRLID